MITIIMITAKEAIGCIVGRDCVPVDLSSVQTMLTLGSLEFICEGFGIRVYGKRQ